MNNSKGFTLVEGLVALSCLLILTSFLFPLMFLILQKQSEEKQEVTAIRLLYEKVEDHFVNGLSTNQSFQIDGTDYTISFLDVNEQLWKVCVAYANKQKCIKQEF
ncbi:competence type IV pilus minor pilin ComGE [Heyndrickxia sporothermodurans]